MMNYTLRKYFWFHEFIFLYLAFSTSVVNCSDGKQSTLKSCLKVTLKVKNFLMDRNACNVDELFLADFADCTQGMYNQFKSTNWTTVKEIIPGMERFIKEIAPQMAKKAGKNALRFTPFYLFYKTVELYGRAVELELDRAWHRKELTYLEDKKIRPLLEQIERDILPLLVKLDSATLSKIKDLDSHTKELKAMSATVYKDFKDAHVNKACSFGVGIVVLCVCAVPVFFGDPRLAKVACGLAIPCAGLCAYSYYSFSDSGQKLQILIDDVDLLCNEIADYLILLKRKFPSY